jgi:hypothetical protein
MKRLIIFVLACVIAAQAASAPLPSAPTPNVDNNGFRRTCDVLFGAGVSLPVGLATHRPWAGLLAGFAAGIANEARYGSHFNAYHLSLIGAGSIASYGVNKLEMHLERRHRGTALPTAR